MANKDLADEQYVELLELVQSFKDEERKQSLSILYFDYEDRVKTAPASSKLNFHNAFEGGYLDHVLRVIKAAKMMTKLYDKMGGYVDYTEDEMLFAAMHHDLGKLGTLEQPYFIEQTSEWHRTNQYAMFKHNDNAQWFDTTDLTFYILQQYGVKMNQTEALGIRLADGAYVDSNRKYLSNYGAGPCPLHTALPYVLHWADHMSAHVEGGVFRKQWIEGLKKGV